MNKSSTICNACGEDNDPTSEFCINCGSNLEVKQSSKEESEKEQKSDYQKWKTSVPSLIGVCVFLVFIDLVTSPGLTWAYWPVVPIILFAIIVPFFKFKME